jgi:hypothetical protein
MTAIVAVCLSLGALGGAQDVDTSNTAVIQAIGQGVDFLIADQNADGSWGGVKNATFTSAFGNPATYHCWTVGTTGLVVRALLERSDTEAALAAADRGLDFLIANADLKRPAEWDVDNVWGLVYGLGTLSNALKHPHFVGTPRAAEIRAGAETMLNRLLRYQSPGGGWGYYAFPNAAYRPEWSTSFTSAVGLLAMVEAREAGIKVPEKPFQGAIRAIERCRLPNGAYSYGINAVPRHMRLESIDQVKGSLGRIQVCNYALHRAGVKLPDGAMRQGLDQLFRHHKFLDVGRNKPIPHEAYYAVAAYFYFFAHYYASHVIESLPEDTREIYEASLRREVLKCQQDDGTFWDFWIANTTKPYGTSFAIMSLGRTLPEPKNE